MAIKLNPEARFSHFIKHIQRPGGLVTAKPSGYAKVPDPTEETDRFPDCDK
jgi:hypothetical protein